MNRKRDSTLADLKRELAEARAERDEARQRLAERTSERDEALAREAATGEVLQVVSSSSGDLRPVWDAMLEKAIRLCRADQGDVFRLQDGVYRMAGAWGIPEAYREIEANIAIRPGRDTLVGRVATQAEAVQIVDVQADPEYGPKEDAQVGSVQTMLGVPLMRAGVAIGVFGLGRRRVEAFSESEVNLVTGFAQQAVIAMENARLITETREALEQQSATAEVLSVINASPGDVTPAFETMLEKATRLCDAEFGLLQLYDGAGGGFRFVAGYDLPPAVVDYLRQRESTGDPIRPLPGGIFGPLIAGEASIQIADIGEWDRYRSGAAPMHRVFHELGGARTWLTVALRKDGALSGLLSLYRCEVRPFSDRHLVLLRNFAAQAEIAIENARLLTETKEALEQQTATAEVLQVINSSPGDLAPVFDAMLEKAMRLCDATFGMLNTYDGKRFHYGAERGVPAAYEEFRRSNIRAEGHVYGAGTSPARMVDGEDLVHNPDLKAEDAYQRGEPYRRALVDLGGARSHLAVTLRKDGALVGFLAIYRQEVRPFSDKQIALLQNFAAQAVIAMENARLITETREALEQQTATAEVLGVINSSPGDLKPVFDAILEKAHTLLGASYGLLGTYDGEQFRAVATHGLAGPIDALVREPFHPPPGSPHERLVTGEPVVHIADLATEKIWEQDDPKRLATLKMGIRTLLFVPLRKDDLLLGYISADRLEVKPFTGKEIALLQNFAAQAVIAMENARLITETQEALEQQTATSDVLKVISQSAFDLEPVLQTVLDTTMRLCGSSQGSIFRLGEDGLYRQAVGSGMQREYYEIEAQQEIRPGSATLVGRTAAAARPIQITDAWADPDYAPKADARVGQLRTMLGVPLLREGTPIGVICTARTIVQPFTEKEIELVATFADQAVIAIENARLLGELRQRQAELRVTFDNMADGVAMFDQTLRLAAWNRNFQELLDLPDELLAERPGFDDYIRYLSERGEFGASDPENEIARLRSRLADHYGFERIRPDGTVIEVRNNPMPDGGVVVIYSDITERKRSEEEIRAARDAAETAYRNLQAAQAKLIQAQKMAALGQLTAGIAHEIKNPLNFVNNFASLSVELLDELKETAAPALATLDEDKRADVDDTMELLTGNLEKIAEHGKRADNIVKSMLEHSRGVSGERREVDLNAVIEEALNLAYHGARAQDQSFNITLERDYAQSLKPIELAPQEMTRVFLNLFGNGFYAANKRVHANGGAGFRPLLHVATQDLGDAVEIKVRDNGTGIPPEIKDKLFQPFFTTKPTGEGTGLGLSISYDIVTQQHGGTITVASEPGAYTEFTIRLPRQ